jgi:signal peptidase I
MASVLLASLAAAALPFNVSSELRADELLVGRTVIPTLARRWESSTAFTERRNALFAAGCYPGVDYEILAAQPEDGTVTIRPAYPLVKRLERDDWPVTVPCTLPVRWMDPAMYNLLTLAVSLTLGLSWLLLGGLLASALTLSIIPSASMEPSLIPGDAVLVEKLSPRLGLRPRAADGEMVFFEPPEALQEIVASRKAAAAVERGGATAAGTPASASAEPEGSPFRPLGRRQQLFVKRLVAGPGSEVSVSATGVVTVDGAEISREPVASGSAVGALLRPTSTYRLPDRQYFVLGDNEGVSVDSRCWGALQADKIVGRPLFRVAPLSRFGPIK